MRERLKQIGLNEEGIGMVYMALTLVILLGMAGVALDGSNAYAQRRRMQTAADAAAAAGTRLLALDETSAGIDAEVQKIATTNGATSANWTYTDDGKGVNVTVEHEVDTYFAKVMGYDSLTVTAVAQAGYAPITAVGNLTPLAINGCDCVNFNSLPANINETSFAGGVERVYKINNQRDASIDFILYLPELDPGYAATEANRPYYMFRDPDGNGTLTEYGDGTANSVQEVINANGDGFTINFQFSGRTSTPPDGQSPKCEKGCPKDYSEWYYYSTTTGTLTGIPGTRYDGAIVNVIRRKASFQIGKGAGIHSDDLGAASWLTLDVVQQPTTGVTLQTHNERGDNNMKLVEEEKETTVTAPTSVVIPLNDNKNSSYKVELISHVGASWTYKVTELTGRDLSHWDLGIESCLDKIESYNPTSGYDAGTDGSTGFVGIKWDTEDSFSSGEFTFVLDKSYPTGIVNALAKAGTQSQTGAIAGPVCDGSVTVQEEDPEVEFCTYNLNVNPGEVFNIHNYVRYKDSDYENVAIDWTKLYFTYTEAGADDPTNPADWHLTDFNGGASVTTSAADAATGTGNHGDGEYRIYIVRNSQSQYDDHMTIRISSDQTSDVEDAQCAGTEEPPPTTETPCTLAWLDWNGGLASNTELVNDINNPSNSGTWSVGDWVNAGPEVANVAAVADALEEWLNEPMTVALYGDGDQDSGYQICGFAEFTLEDFDFASLPPWIQGNFDPANVRGETIDKDADDFGLRDVRFESP